jgi:hypothetical protein
MFPPEWMGSAVEILKLGVIGLGFILALMAFMLLTREQKKSEPHIRIIHAIYTFMAFAVVLCGVGLYAQMGTATDKGIVIKLQDANANFEAKILESDEKLIAKDMEITTLKNKLGDLTKEITRIKTGSVNWDYRPNGNKFTCRVNGRSVGVTLDCRNHGSCNNRQLNRGICALNYSDQIWQ